MKMITLPAIIMFLTSGCTALMSSNDVALPGSEEYSELMFLELKDPRGTISGLNGIFIDIEKKTYGINDRVAKFADCNVDENVTLRLICAVIDVPQSGEDASGSRAAKDDLCERISLSELLRGRAIVQKKTYGKISGIVTCSDSPTNPSARISVVVIDDRYVEAIYVDNFAPETGEIAQSQVYISVGTRHSVRSYFEFE